MSDDILVRHCSPTLAGLKTGSMFTCPFADEAELHGWLRRFNRCLGWKGLRLIPLRCEDHRALVYVYRPARLSRDLMQQGACDLLQRLGYCPEQPGQCLRHLMRRLGENGPFPHEIGLFLGYPPADVLGFMNDPTCCKCVGCWKVYGDEIVAKKRFAQYRKCSAVYYRRFMQGTTIERLTVAV